MDDDQQIQQLPLQEDASVDASSVAETPHRHHKHSRRLCHKRQQQQQQRVDGARPSHVHRPPVCRCQLTTLEATAARMLTCSATIRSYVVGLHELERWLQGVSNDIGVLTDRVRRVEEAFCVDDEGDEADEGPAGGGPRRRVRRRRAARSLDDQVDHLFLASCYADLARKVWSADEENGERGGGQLQCGAEEEASSRGDPPSTAARVVATKHCQESWSSLLQPIHDVALQAALSILRASDSRHWIESEHRPQKQNSTNDSRSPDQPLQSSRPSFLVDDGAMTDAQCREYGSLLAAMPSFLSVWARYTVTDNTADATDAASFATPLRSLVSMLARSFYRAILPSGDDACILEALREFRDFVDESRVFLRSFVLDAGLKVRIVAAAAASSASREERLSDSGGPDLFMPRGVSPTALLDNLVALIGKDIGRRIQTENYAAGLLLSQLERCLQEKPTDADERAAALHSRRRLLDMCARYDNAAALTQSLVTCSVERVRAETRQTVDRCAEATDNCRPLYHIVCVD